jgi:3-methyladenine DNA glycosylase/8-oxoguanine DNA glycosylase
VQASCRTLSCATPLDARLTFGPLGGGPSARLARDDWWRALNTPDGPATIHVQVDRCAARVAVHAWGPGRDWVVERAAAITGVGDDPQEFVPRPGVVARLVHRHAGLRLVRLGCTMDLAAATIVEQRVTTVEARRAWRTLVHRHGRPTPHAPDAPGLRVPPSAEALRSLPDWEWRRVGVEAKRSTTVRRVAADATRIDRSAGEGAGELDRRLRSLRGVGPWTAATVVHYAAGDADAVPVGDWHLPGHVGHALAAEPDADDARMLELLDEFRPHRARVWRLIVAGTRPPPRRAPRARIIGLLQAEASRPRGTTRPARQ